MVLVGEGVEVEPLPVELADLLPVEEDELLVFPVPEELDGAGEELSPVDPGDCPDEEEPLVEEGVDFVGVGVDVDPEELPLPVVDLDEFPEDEEGVFPEEPELESPVPVVVLLGVDPDGELVSDLVGAGVVPEEVDGLDVVLSGVDPVDELGELSLFAGGVVPVEPEEFLSPAEELPEAGVLLELVCFWLDELEELLFPVLPVPCPLVLPDEPEPELSLPEEDPESFPLPVPESPPP